MTLHIYMDVLLHISFYMIEGAVRNILVLTKYICIYIHKCVILHVILNDWRSRLKFSCLDHIYIYIKVNVWLHILVCIIEGANWNVLVLTISVHYSLGLSWLQEECFIIYIYIYIFVIAHLEGVDWNLLALTIYI